jgi:redox-sensitive bicupin YhaK (pirin superfamily)
MSDHILGSLRATYPYDAIVQKLVSRTAQVGGEQVRRALPQRERRTVGAWCFVDHFGPSDPGAHDGLEVGPHPHCGLSTVTWLIEGMAVHRDSLGSEQPIRPGQLNLMTAGHGIAHAEQTPVERRGALHGVQFWVAQPEATRHGAAAFEHHTELPRLGVGPWAATVLMGELDGVRSPARTDSPLVGVELLATGAGAAEVPLDPRFEHALVVVEGRIAAGGEPLAIGEVGILEVGDESVRIETDGPARWLLIGGEPFEARVQMWWNFVGRTREEMTAAVADWNGGDERFGRVHSSLERIPAPSTPWAD